MQNILYHEMQVSAAMIQPLLMCVQDIPALGTNKSSMLGKDY